MNDKLANWRWVVGSLLLTSSLATGLWGLSTSDVLADRGESEREHASDRNSGRDGDDGGGSRAQGAARNASYQQECGSCHLPYPARFLAAANWQSMMGGLNDHFGENAELDEATRSALQQYLVANSADQGNYQGRRYLDQSGQGSLRITEQRFFLRKHDEIPRRMVADNPKVGSFSQCDACHQNAAQGDFDEDGVKIPGFGRWDD